MTGSAAQTPRPGMGVCSLLITAAIPNLPASAIREKRLPWSVWIDGEEVWASNLYNELSVNSEGTAVGEAQVSARQLLRALEMARPGATVKEILDLTDTDPSSPAGTTTATATGLYDRWKLKVRIDGTYEEFPIDMGVSGHP